MAAAMETTNNTGTTVRSLMESFERGEIDFSALLAEMTEHVCAEGPQNDRPARDRFQSAEFAINAASAERREYDDPRARTQRKQCNPTKKSRACIFYSFESSSLPHACDSEYRRCGWI